MAPKSHRLFVASLLAASLAFAAAPPPPAGEAAQLRQVFAEPLQTVDHWNEVPPQIRNAVTAGWHDAAIAEPGQPFQVTDIITDRSLPRRRLIAAAHTPHAWIVYYETGGIAHTFHFAVCPFAGRPAAYFDVPPPNGQEKDGLERLRTVVQKGQARTSLWDPWPSPPRE